MRMAIAATAPSFAAKRARYEALMETVRTRKTSRAFRPDIAVPREHIEFVLEAARHADLHPGGASASHAHLDGLAGRDRNLVGAHVA
jgi:hypothetical protein